MSIFTVNRWLGHALWLACLLAAVGAPAAEPPQATREAGQSLPVRVEALLTHPRLRITASPPREAFPPDRTEVLVTVSGPQGKILDRRAEPDPKAGGFQVQIDGQQLPAGRIALEVTAVNRQSGKCLTAQRTLDRPLKPEWLGTTVGTSDTVPAPWTPIGVEGSSVSVWGRTYGFERSALPTEVVVQGTSILAGPIVLRGRSSGEAIAWQPEPVAWTAKKPVSASLAWRASAKGLSLEGSTCVEYDGMVRVDLVIRPTGEKALCEELVLEVPLKSPYARYLYHFPGQWGSVANSGYLPQQGWTHAFKPFVWLGDEDRGFSWFCESDENWEPADPNRAITVGRQGETVVLRCHLIGRPRQISGPLSYTFGFQATPVKNPQKMVWDYRITHHGNYGLEKQPQLDWLASMGVRTICFHEHWSPYQSYPDVTEENRPRLRSLVDACHARGLSLLLYMARQFADNAPEWELHSTESLVAPKYGLYVRQPQQESYYVCWRSPWKDFCLFHLDRLLAEFGHDGWYLDGPEWPMACMNREHGCGYAAADGTVHPTYDIFATRDFMKRLYVLTRQRKPEAQLNIHNSTVMVIPTLGWGTSSWGGEQLDAIQGPVKTLDTLPMDAFRTEFLGRQWGVPSEFLVYDGKPYYAKDLLAYTLLHGVLIRPFSNEQVARISRLWKAYDAFPLRDAKMHPYWSNAELLECSPSGVYATAYERSGEGLLLFVSNLGDQPVQGRVAIRTSRLGWKGLGKSWDAISGEPVAREAETLMLSLGKWEYRVVRVQP